MAALMKSLGRHSKYTRRAHRGRKSPVPAAGLRQVHWIGQMAIGVAPRAWSLKAANDPIA